MLTELISYIYKREEEQTYEKIWFSFTWVYRWDCGTS